MWDYDVAVLGGLFPNGMEEEIIKKSRATLPFAASAHLWNIVKGLDNNLKSPAKIINILPVASYPRRYDDLFIPEFSFSHTEGSRDINAGYFNLTLAKKLSRKIASVHHAQNWAKSNDGRLKILIVYSASPMYLEAAKRLKKICPNSHICLVVPDIPDYTDIDKEGRVLYTFLRKLRIKGVFDKIDVVDSFVFLAEAMEEYFGAGKPYIIQEGICGAEPEFDNIEPGKGLKTITYTGSFTKKYGILDLVYAFTKIDRDDYRLCLCGAGEAESEIRAIVKTDKRIIYKGAILREEALIKQRNATILVNPRNAEGEYTKYSFPSKIMEYMMSGRPTLCFKLPGIPDEYDEYLDYFSSSDLDTMAKDIVNLCESGEDSLREKGERAKRFVLLNKNADVQAEKLLEMVDRCVKGEWSR